MVIVVGEGQGDELGFEAEEGDVELGVAVEEFGGGEGVGFILFGFGFGAAEDLGFAAEEGDVAVLLTG